MGGVKETGERRPRGGAAELRLFKGLRCGPMMLIIESIRSPAPLVLEILLLKDGNLVCGGGGVLGMFYLSAAWELSQRRGRTSESEPCVRNQVATTQTSPSQSGAAILGFIRFKRRLHSPEDKSLCWKVINDTFASRRYDSECCCAV